MSKAGARYWGLPLDLSVSINSRNTSPRILSFNIPTFSPHVKKNKPLSHCLSIILRVFRSDSQLRFQNLIASSAFRTSSALSVLSLQVISLIHNDPLSQSPARRTVRKAIITHYVLLIFFNAVSSGAVITLSASMRNLNAMPRACSI
jgi:hypothetical protein